MVRGEESSVSLPVTAGVDGSQGSTAALDWAAAEAELRDGGLRLVYATRWAEHQLGAMKVSHEDRAGAAESVLAVTGRHVGSRHPDLALTADEVEDAPVSVLLAAAEAELLVVGSHGLGSVRGFIIGSVGQEVVAEAERPVVLVRWCTAGLRTTLGSELRPFGAGGDRRALAVDPVTEVTEDDATELSGREADPEGREGGEHARGRRHPGVVQG
ncbi:universal stress protein [Streptomyces sp. NPDC093089]|uniref:universal stress protein n=1 Tax=Streptomyces sp. NPDC093089 TaxID=3366024 RepID=UPI00380605CC